MNAEAQTYIDGIAPEHRPLFDRVHRLILEAYPEADVVLAYGMPTYRVGDRRLHVGVWRHGISVYGWDQHRRRCAPPCATAPPRSPPATETRPEQCAGRGP